MTDFVIVIAAALGLAGPGTPLPSAAPPPVVRAAPAAEPRVFHDEVSCEQAAAAMAVPHGSRPVCLPVEELVGESANPY